MSRITIKEVEVRVKFINDILQNKQAKKSIRLGSRNGYLAIDMYSDTVCLNTIYAGNTREVYERLCGMLNMITLLDNNAW